MIEETSASGKKMKISDFQTKDVINIVDGKRLGQISDLELDLRRGVIDAVIVPGYTRFMGLFGGGADLVIPWRNIVKIGADVVLVKLEEPRIPQGQEDREMMYLERPDRSERRTY
ncbi:MULTISPECIES: YlmC/YmxH family sporulation protein [unclassified Paenibacillus]|uniref:YlmC/YmxH family sporulation protein n=1 Tax=unclassified Paenibacillus TaxID=185978 RepID=UPI0003E23B9C|nr:MULTISPECIES: YlmC/YmxH family sporulation protein [unclassified Paenibacillus]ETT56658.1 sporulation protein, YlmC/YmxH family [Paenibacillus sp. FSL R7-269]OMG00390.1 sporulation protein, YlmC/YmxH family [Paenibacillus sp. FSL R7-0337]